MDLFNRRVHLTGAPAAYMAFATGMRDYVSEKLEQDVSLWSIMFGAPAGTLVYSARFDGVAGVHAMQAKLLSDETYMARAAEGTPMSAAPPEDSLAQPIHGELGDPPPVGSFATVTTAVVANGAYAEAIGWGVEMAQLVEKIASVPTMFLMNSFGTFGQVTWINVAADAAAADAAGNAVNGDPDYMGRLSDVGNLFIPGSGHRSVATRVA